MEFHLKKNLFLKDTSLSERFISSKSDVTFFNSTRQPTLKSRSYLYPLSPELLYMALLQRLHFPAHP